MFYTESNLLIFDHTLIISFASVKNILPLGSTFA